MRSRTSVALVIASTLITGGDAMSESRPGSVIALPRPDPTGSVTLQKALRERRSVREYAQGALSLPEVSNLLWAAQGVTGARGERTAPSAGALYPLEIYLVAGEVTGLDPGIYRYQPREHALARVSAGDCRSALAGAAVGQEWMRDAPVLIAVAAVLERTARKYHERAPRYVNMEAGAVAQDVHLEAAALGLGTVIVGAFEDEVVKRVLGLPADEDPLVLMPVGRKK
jgi:SagB-type dehydrogenase family enzyme